jgi:hypothetical protein
MIPRQLPRRELLADLGGEDAVSTRDHAVVEMAVRTKLYVDSIDVWCLSHHPSSSSWAWSRSSGLNRGR